MDDTWDMTDEEHSVRAQAMFQDALDRMTPFQRYLHDNGLFDDVIRPELSPEDEVLEPRNLCAESDFECAHCIGYVKRDGWVIFCTCEHHKNEGPREVPFDHCEYLGCDSCIGVVIENGVSSHCTCAHHQEEIADYIQHAEDKALWMHSV